MVYISMRLIFNTISWNNCSFNIARGIQILQGSNNNSITYNTVMNNPTSGIYLYQSDGANVPVIGNYVASNYVSGATATYEAGYLNQGANNNYVYNNTVTGNYYGIYIAAACNNT